jgi:hypothetical protein
MTFAPTPLVLSLSKGCTSSRARKEGQGFNKLSSNGVVYG